MTNRPPKHTDLTELEGDPGPRAHVDVPLPLLNEVGARIGWRGYNVQLFARTARRSPGEVAVAFAIALACGCGCAVLAKEVLGLSGLLSAAFIPGAVIVYVAFYVLVRMLVRPRAPNSSRRLNRRRRRF